VGDEPLPVAVADGNNVGAGLTGSATSWFALGERLRWSGEGELLPAASDWRRKKTSPLASGGGVNGNGGRRGGGAR